jgi:rare lipoprotein A
VQREIAFALAVLCLTVQLDSTALAQGEQHASARAAAKVTKVKPREGLASYYGPGLQGKRMANGKPLNMNAMVAAHPTYPLGTVVRVTNLKNMRSARLRIEDRGPTPANRKEGVIIDVSLAAAKALDFVDDGRVPVRVEVLKWGT